MFVGLLVTPVILAFLVGFLSRNVLAGLAAGALLLCVEFIVLAYPHNEIRQHCELSDSCKAG